MLRTTSFFVVLLFSFLHSFAYSEQVPFGPSGRQDAFCDSICHVMQNTDSVSAMAIYNDVKEWAEQKGDVRLVYALRIITLDKYIITALQYKTEGEKDLMHLIDELGNKNLEMLRAQAAFILSRYYWNNKHYAAGFEYGIRSYNYLNNYRKDDEEQNKADFISSVGGMYYHFKDFAHAKKYFLESIEAMDIEKNIGGISLLNTTALTYLSLEKYDSAKYYFIAAKDLATKKESNIWPQIIDGNFILC